ncbi:MAG TPA: glycoside-pentoside-hexuronide (GPH):cation symporter [Candidatus Fournierella pullicola]|uniref:Glycoside-pentoside-hexuronide (GPH):cation symporter n=1 Tax=Candidatus Allofournierella pullicola TaxID=2838596 RepID=A0A9D1V326_9FIRM|nr:glycoside-pentoside-hexuronide (GPH):cation symporter [Candidatus Fournierella pullicola]
MKGTAKQALGYGLGAVGKDMVYALVSGFILYYYNDILGISGTFTGVMMMAARVFDAFNDPLMGVVVEKTNTPFGKFRPWIFTGTVTNALILYGMFAMPASLTGTAMLVYASAAYVLWGVTYTLMDIPFWSMIPAITSSGKERENLSVIGRTCAAVGYAVPTVLTMLLVVRLGSGEREGFAIFAAAVAVVFVVTELVCVALVREKLTERQKAATVKEMFSALIHNDQAMVVVVGIVVFNASLYLTTQLAVYFFKYDIGNSDLFSLFGTVGGVGQILSMVSLPLLRRRWGGKQILVGALGVTIAGYLALFALSMAGVRAVAPLAATAFVIYIGFGLATVLTTVFLADTVDYGEYKTGRRNESVVFSMQTFVVKLASAVSVLIAGVGIDLIGLDDTAAVQTESTLLGLRLLMVALPVAGLVFSILYFVRKYRLTEAENARISEALRQREGSKG